MCILGINATVIDNITIVSNTQLGGGSVVIKNIEHSGLYVGNPTRFIR
jgi:acetyltransferase-like isoleucine patch superfamily enzyme